MQNQRLNVISLALVNLFALVSASVATAATSQPNPPAKAAAAPGPAAKAIPWDQIGAKAGAIYQGGGLRVTPTAQGARLHCGFQRLDGEATRDGLWLTSTVSNTVNERFRIVAQTVGRQVLESGSPLSLSLEPNACQSDRGLPHSRTRAKLGPPLCLPLQGTVFVTENVVRFVRPGLVEEYSVSMDGVRQDFVMPERPAGEGDLQLGLAVSGAARVEPMPGGARLVLERSGRKIAYSRLRATDATGRELPARIEAAAADATAEGKLADAAVARQNTAMVAREDSGALPRRRYADLRVVVNDAGAVYPVRIDPTFSDDNWISMGGILGADRDVYAAVVDGAGNLYIGGTFAVVGETAANRIAKWNGSEWSALGEGMNGSVSALATSGSDLYAGGYFTTAGGSAATNIAKWSGSRWSPLGEGINGLVSALAVSGSDLYAGGSFSTAGGKAATNIAKWSGSEWSALGAGISGELPSPATEVRALAVLGSDLYVGGSFSTAGGSAATNIAKWNGTEWSALGLGVSAGDFHLYTEAGVHALAVSGSNLYAGGIFSTAGGSAATNIARWNGSEWLALGDGMNGRIGALAVSGSDLYAGGYFTLAGGGAATNIAKWSGSEWSASGEGMNGSVTALVISGSDLYAGGYFTTAGGSPVNHVSKWNGSGWSALGEGAWISAYVYALAVSGSDLYAGGYFTTAGGSPVNHIAKWNGSAWSALGEGMNGGVSALAVLGSDLYAGGNFTTAGGHAANCIAKWDGNAWSALGSGMSGTYPWVYALAVSGSDLYAGGWFTHAGGNTANCIAKWNGSAWSALGSGMNSDIQALAVSGSDLYAGGYFTMAGGREANYIAKWNGSAWSALGSGMSGPVPYVLALAVSGYDLYAGGCFETAGGSAANHIAKWDGSAWFTLGSGVNSLVYALAVSGANLYAGGAFTMAGGSAANFIAKWNGSEWSALGSGMNGDVDALAVSGCDLYAGGRFTTAGDKVSASAAKAIAIAGDWLRIQKGVPAPGTNTLNYVGVPNAQYLIQFATNLTTSPWFTLATNTVAANGRGSLVDSTAISGQRFYRITTP